MAAEKQKGAATGAPTIIIKKKKKGGHDGHHGGAWTVAYAEFVTAMMAFFLLLWLLNVTTSDQKQGISDYFSPLGISRTTSGSGGVLGGRTLSSPGAMLSTTAPLTPYDAVRGAPGEAAAKALDEDPEEPEEPNYQKEMPGYAAELYERQLESAAERFGIPGKQPIESLQDFARRVRMARPTYPDQRPEESRLSFQRRLDRAARACEAGPESVRPSLTERIAREIGDGLLAIDGDRVRPTPRGMDFADGIARRLMAATPGSG